MESIIPVLGSVFAINTLFIILIGVISGIIIGALPGLSANMGVALLIPFTFGMEPASGLIMLTAVYTAAIYGGSIPAILLHTPGTSASAATAIDGYELTKQGKATTAIRIATFASAFGGLVSGLFLLLLTPPLSLISLKFGPAEYFLLALFGLTAIASVSTNSITKGLISGGLGLLIGTVGMEINSGFPRFTFGIPELYSGISFVPALIGLFSLSQVFIIVKKSNESVSKNKLEFKDFRLFPKKKEIKEVGKTTIRSSLIGVLVGILPGAGGDVASWVSYSEGKRFSKIPEKYGKGSIEAIASSEAANNAVTGSSLIPLLTLGIPGSATAAVLLGGLMIQGLVPGRELFTTHGEITYTLMIGFIIANIMMYFVGMVFSQYFQTITSIPNKVLAPMVVILCIIGSYALGNNMYDVWIMVIFGLIGYLMRNQGYHPAPLVLGLILGTVVEKGFKQTMLLSNGEFFSYILVRPISIVLILLILIAILTPLLLSVKKKKEQQKMDDLQG